LFASVEVEDGPSLDEAGSLPMTIRVDEGPHRSIGAGGGYSTDIGFGGQVFWEHRNFFGENERLRLTLAAAEIQQSIGADFRKPAFLRRDQTLLMNVSASNEDTDAFEQQSISSFVGLERLFSPRWRGVAGVSVSYLSTEDEQGRRNFLLFGLPITATRHMTDSLLDPTRGTRLDFAVTPYTGGGAEQLLFLQSSVAGSVYRAIDRRKRFVLAGRARVGSTVGEATEAIPADKRFYAGGGGSIRGYKYQSVGPLDTRRDPLGGRSLLELGGELRVRVTDSIGVVPFIDGGTVFDAPYPSFDETIRWAAGLGLRYFTDFGPLRLDVAFPINRRDDVDNRFEFYVSFGQAF
jgi:translocation and assembly module TamA